MPFDFKVYDAKCALMDADQLQREWNHYTRLISGSATATTFSSIAFIPTAGISAIGLLYSAPAIHNARRKRQIIDRHLARLDVSHRTRKRDVTTGVMFAGTVSSISMGTGDWGVEHIMEFGIEKAHETAVEATTEAALGASGMLLEDTYMNHKKEKELEKATRVKASLVGCL